MYSSFNRPLTCLTAALLIAATFLAIAVAPEPASASGTRLSAQSARFPLA